MNYLYLNNKYKNILEGNLEICFESKIVDKDNNKLICEYKNKKVILYVDNYYEFKIGDYVYVRGISQEVLSNRIENAFNYKEYLKYKKIYGIIYVDIIYRLDRNFSINIIKEKVFEYIDRYIKDVNSNMLVKALVLGDTSLFSEDLNNDLKSNGIVHLFAVSGLHISLFVMLLGLVFKFFNVNDFVSDIIISIFLLLYIVITSFSPSILRASLMFYLSILNKRLFKNIFSALDICSISFIILLIVNPFIVFNLGFVLSYLVCFVLILSSDLIKTKNGFLKVLYMSIYSFIFSLPIIINLNYEINILSPIVNVLFISIASSVILPSTFILIFIPILGFVYKYLIDVFLLLIKLCAGFNISISFPYFDDLFLIMYYSFLLLMFICWYNKKIRNFFIFMLVLFLIGFNNSAFFYHENTIDCLYLNDGEAMLIRNKNKVILIDSGDGKNDEVLNFLRSKGIKKIDLFIITHNHNDHNGGAKEILDKIDVSCLMISSVDDSAFNKYENVYIARPKDFLYVGDVRIEVLYPYEKKEDENDNSLVTYISFCEYNILCLGDLTCSYEEEVIEYLKINNLKVDIIKIGHHGSSTSTSNELLDMCKAKYAIIMIGKKWVNVFPDLSIINRLNEYNIKVLSTKVLYSFTLHFYNKSIYISSVH